MPGVDSPPHSQKTGDLGHHIQGRYSYQRILECPKRSFVCDNNQLGEAICPLFLQDHRQADSVLPEHG